MNNTLKRAVNDGMKLIQVSRQWYRQIHDKDFYKKVIQKTFALKTI